LNLSVGRGGVGSGIDSIVLIGEMFVNWVVTEFLEGSVGGFGKEVDEAGGTLKACPIE